MLKTFPVLLAAAVMPVLGAGHSGFNVHDDLLAFPQPAQFQVVFPESYILQADAESKLTFASTRASAKQVSHAPETSDHGVSVAKSTKGETDTEAGFDSSPELPQTYEHMIVNSTKYLCSVPQVQQVSGSNLSASTTEAEEAEEQEKELERARQRGSELIRHTGTSCLYYLHGYWSYSFCYNSQVKQFRQMQAGKNGAPRFPPVEDTNVPSFILGQYRGPKSLAARPKSATYRSATSITPENEIGESTADEEQQERATDLVEVESSGNIRYLVQKLDDGTVCDLTNQPRKIAVEYHCGPGPDKIVSVKEVSTCSYRMQVFTPKLCDDIAFQPPQEMPQHQIVCREILSDAEDVAKWEARKAAGDSEDSNAEAHAGTIQDGREYKTADQNSVGAAGAEGKEGYRSRRPVIGGIELGGQKVVGKEGRRIDPPLDFLPRLANANNEDGEVLRTETVARYNPEENNGRVQRLSDQDLSNRDVGPQDLIEIKKMISEMQKLQPDRRWRIVMEDREDNVRVLMAVFEDTLDLDEVAAATGDDGKNRKTDKKKKVSEKKETNEQNGGRHAMTDQTPPSADSHDDIEEGESTNDYRDEGEGSEEEYYPHEEL